jgi:hypothetical protein
MVRSVGIKGLRALGGWGGGGGESTVRIRNFNTRSSQVRKIGKIRLKARY